MGAAAAGASTVLSAGLQIAGALGQAKSAKTESQIRSIRYQTQAEAGRVRAVQIHAGYAEDLQTSLANINAITASQGRGIDSATSRALMERASDVSQRLALTAASNERLRSLGSEADARAAERAGAEAMRASYLRMVEPGFKLAQGLSEFGKGFGGGW